MQRKFEEFVRSLSASEERISNVHAMAGNLISHDHAEQKLIKAKCDEVDRMWNETKELAQARLEVNASEGIYSVYLD
jgi:vacuolar-type H+-ATPase subunit I/STV1